ncbi:MAG: topoisomerase DNA-binding C4 zinc finger domain-containing protein [Eubacterium sp.]|nr:topoisomerase DNA-binding C4 zinc finger domain-containing protein [Eubacterium sp.]
MITTTKGKLNNKFTPDYVVFDLETSGVYPQKDQIIEIAALKVRDHKVVDEFSTLVNPQCHISEAASNVNGIYDHMVKDAPLISEALPKFIEFIEDLPLLGHNIHVFDMKFIYRDCQEYLDGVPDNDYIDTLPLARKSLPEMAHHRMTDLARHYDISIDGAHRALKDCYMTQEVYEHFEEEMKLLEEGKKELPVCPKCGKKMILRMSDFGEFWGCNGYPRCRYTMKK